MLGASNLSVNRRFRLLDGAKAAIQEGLRRFPNGWQADQLRQTLERYEKASAEPIEPPLTTAP
jgi:hypothetical protein